MVAMVTHERLTTRNVATQSSFVSTSFFLGISTKYCTPEISWSVSRGEILSSSDFIDKVFLKFHLSIRRLTATSPQKYDCCHLTYSSRHQKFDSLRRFRSKLWWNDPLYFYYNNLSIFLIHKASKYVAYIQVLSSCITYHLGKIIYLHDSLQGWALQKLFNPNIYIKLMTINIESRVILSWNMKAMLYQIVKFLTTMYNEQMPIWFLPKMIFWEWNKKQH